MDIKSEKQSLIEWISQLEDESIIEDLMMFRENSANGRDWWNEISEEEKKGIVEGLKDVEEGRVVSYEEVKKELMNCFKITKKSNYFRNKYNRDQLPAYTFNI